MRQAQRIFGIRVLLPAATFILGCSLTLFATRLTPSGRQHCQPRHLQAETDYLLVILVLSAPQNGDRRDAIRKTWLKLQPGYEDDALLAETIHVPEYNADGFVVGETIVEQQANFRKYLNWLSSRRKARPNPETRVKVTHRFVVGQQGLSRIVSNQLAYEQQENNDMMLLDGFEDSYRNLTRKLLVTMDRTVREFSFKYILKCDDDTYVKLGDVVSELQLYDDNLAKKTWTTNGPPDLYWGYFNGRANVKIRGQWKETNWNACDRYVPYALGGGYIVSYGIAQYVADNRDQLATFVSEDISMGTWLMPLRTVYRRHDVRFDTGYMPRACRTHHLVLHKREVIDLRRLRAGDECSFAGASDLTIKRPPTYHYNWTLSPLKCCDTLMDQ